MSLAFLRKICSQLCGLYFWFQLMHWPMQQQQKKPFLFKLLHYLAYSLFILNSPLNKPVFVIIPCCFNTAWQSLGHQCLPTYGNHLYKCLENLISQSYAASSWFLVLNLQWSGINIGHIKIGITAPFHNHGITDHSFNTVFTIKNFEQVNLCAEEINEQRWRVDGRWSR